MSTQNLVPDDVRDVVAGFPRTTAEPRRVVIDGTEYPAAAFSQTRDHQPGTRAHAERTARGESLDYQHEGLYCVGAVPAVYEEAKRAGKTALFVELGDRRWYVAAWATERAVAEHGEFHPLGPWIRLTAASGCCARRR
jgi:hypothetical protein